MLAYCLAGSVCAGTFTPQIYNGTWSGKLGNASISVCLENGDGQYFYLNHLKGIRLEKSDSNEHELLEIVKNETVTGKWNIEAISDLKIDGVWTSPDGNRKLKIELIKNEPSKKIYECGETFYEPLVKAIKFKYLQMNFGSIPIREVVTEAGTAFEITSDTPGYKKINNFVGDWIKRQAIESYECKLGGGMDWHADLQPLSTIGNIMVIKDNLPDTYCGGAHGGWYREHYVANVISGEIVDTWDWIKGGRDSVETPEGEQQKKKLRGLIEKLNPRDDCSDYNHMLSVSAPYPDEKGLVFLTSYPYVVRACEDEILVTYEVINEFLTQQGTAALVKVKK
jgi:hypothetical protein